MFKLAITISGPPMSGKSTVAHALGRYLSRMGCNVTVEDELGPGPAALPENEKEALERATSKGMLRVEVDIPAVSLGAGDSVLVRTAQVRPGWRGTGVGRNMG